MDWYLAIRRMSEPAAAWKDRIDSHLAWLHGMHDQGSIVMSGPSTDRSLGIYIMRAGDSAEAISLASGDPLLRSPGATLEVIEWELHQIVGIGAFTVPQAN